MRRLPPAPPPSAELVAVRAAVAALPAADREVLTLTAWEGLSAGEVAVVLGISAPAVRTRLARARARLRHGLDPEDRLTAAGRDRGRS